MKFQFVIGRDEDDSILVSLPLVSAVITLTMTVPPHHHPMACDMLAHLASMVTEQDIFEATQEPAGGPIHMALQYYREKHGVKGDVRFERRGDYITMRIHPTELWAMHESMTAIAGMMYQITEPNTPGAIEKTIKVWLESAEQLTTTMERFAAPLPGGTMIQ